MNTEVGLKSSRQQTLESRGALGSNSTGQLFRKVTGPCFRSNVPLASLDLMPRKSLLVERVWLNRTSKTKRHTQGNGGGHGQDAALVHVKRGGQTRRRDARAPGRCNEFPHTSRAKERRGHGADRTEFFQKRGLFGPF